MTAHQNPSNGGSYMRNADGSLTRINEEGQPVDDEGEIIASAAAASSVEKSARPGRAAGSALTEKEA